jgi:hypothetical protein
MASAPSSRHLKHRRSITVEAYSRDDGLWDLEARLTDVKTRDIELASGVRSAGEPIHDMHLRVTIDERLNVVEVVAQSRAVPYKGECEKIEPDYGKLVGLNLMQGFRHAVRERLGGIAGCTHMTELTAVLPTAAVQAFAGEGIHGREAAKTSSIPVKPFQLDRCHALRSDGAAVREFYPQWYKTPPTSGVREE